jgi:class 3 adenylate cyclase
MYEGRWDEARSVASRALNFQLARGAVWQALGDRSLLATICFRSGDGAAAVRLLEENIEITRTAGAHFATLLYAMQLCVVTAATGDTERSDRFLDLVEKHADLAVKGTVGHLAFARAMTAAATDHREVANVNFAEAAAVFHDYGVVFWEADTLRWWARSLLDGGDRGGALRKISEGIDRLRDSGVGEGYLQPFVALQVEAQGGIDSVTESIAVVAASVVADRPDLRASAGSDGTVTLMFTDLGDSTRLNERLGDRRWLEILAAHHEMVRRIVASYGGTEVKSQGDGFMLVFDSARRAIECGLAIRRGAEAQVTEDNKPLRVRIGVHTGEVVRRGEDFFGRHVNLAARVAAAAAPGEVLVSSLVHDLLAGDHELRFDASRSVELKGFEERHLVYAIHAADD